MDIHHIQASLSSSSSSSSSSIEPAVSESHNTCAADRQSGNFGCLHYRRRCKIRAPCCDEIFDCRHCHNEAKNSLELETLDPHDVPRHQIQKEFSACFLLDFVLWLFVSLCDTEQDVQQYCSNCGVCFGKYFCSICKFFDDDVSKNQYHCDECGICRTGGKENFFHCKTCGCCYSKLMKDGHRCIERAMHHSCPVCFDFLFDTTKDISVLPCGHTIHLECAKEMESHFQYSCPVCSKSICDMSRLWEKLDKVIASTPMPDIYKNKKVWILCNDCGAEGEVQFHVVAHKCLGLQLLQHQTNNRKKTTASCSSTTVPEIVS